MKMEKELQQAVTTLLEKSIKAFESGAEFLAGEIPDVIYQLLLWHATISAVQFVTGVILLVVLVTVDYKIGMHVWKKDHDEYGWDEQFITGYCLLGTVARFSYLIPLSMLNLIWLQIWIAPKIFLIEYAAKLVK
jgi:hypothetical protein